MNIGAFSERIEVMQWAIARGADVNIPDEVD